MLVVSEPDSGSLREKTPEAVSAVALGHEMSREIQVEKLRDDFPGKGAVSVEPRGERLCFLSRELRTRFFTSFCSSVRPEESINSNSFREDAPTFACDRRVVMQRSKKAKTAARRPCSGFEGIGKPSPRVALEGIFDIPLDTTWGGVESPFKFIC